MPLPAIAMPLILQAIKTFIPVGRTASASEKADAKKTLVENNASVTTMLGGIIGAGGVAAYASMDEAIVSIGMAVLSLVLFLVSEKGK